MLLLIFILLFIPGLISAIVEIRANRKKRARANKKLEEFYQWEKRKSNLKDD